MPDSQPNTKTAGKPAIALATLTGQSCIYITLNLLLGGLWLLLFWPVTDYLTVIFSREDFRTNQILLIIILLLVGLQIRTHGFQLRLSELPRLQRLPTALLIGGATAFMLAERYLDINTVSAMLCICSGYGLAGLWMDSSSWRQRLPAALMLIGVLPLGEHLQTFVGYPMRILTAQIVGTILQTVGVPSVGIDTILVFENGVSHVDLPCSGVKSLWTGALFLTAATWIERRPMTARWWLVGLSMGVLLFLANLVRVFLLVAIGQVGGYELLATMLHIPLGVLAFVVVCGITLMFLQTVARKSQISGPVVGDPIPSPRPFDDEKTGDEKTDGESITLADVRRQIRLWPSLALVACLTLLILLYAPRSLTGSAEAATPWRFAGQLITEPLPLTEQETAWFVKDGAESVERVRFQWQDISGSMILVTSRTWRAHHRPERCFEVYGLSLEQSTTHLTSAQQPIRSVRLGNSGIGNMDNDGALSAAYWFQSSQQTTDDYGVRIWSDVSLDRQKWVLVSILFDDVYDLHQPVIDELIQSVHETVAEQL